MSFGKDSNYNFFFMLKLTKWYEKNFLDIVSLDQ